MIESVIDPHFYYGLGVLGLMTISFMAGERRGRRLAGKDD